MKKYFVLALSLASAAGGYAQTLDNPLEMVEGPNACMHAATEGYHKCWWKYTSQKDVVLYLDPKNYASLDVRAIVPGDVKADTVALKKGNLPDYGEAYPVMAGSTVLIGESGSKQLAFDASLHVFKGLGSGTTQDNPLIIEAGADHYLGNPRLNDMQTTYATYTATKSGVLVLTSPAFVAYCSVDGGAETPFTYNEGNYVYSLPVEAGRKYTFSFRNYNPFVFQAKMTFPEPGTLDLPIVLNEGQNSLKAEAGNYYYVFTSKEGGFATVSSREPLPNGCVKVYSSKSSISYDGWMSKSDNGKFDVRFETTRGGDTYYIMVQKTEATPAAETFDFSFEAYQPGSKEANPIVIGTLPATQSGVAPGTTVYYAVDVPAGASKYLMAYALTEVLEPATAVSIYKVGESYSALKGNSNANLEVFGGTDGQRYIIKWESHEDENIDFAVKFVDIAQGDVIANPLPAVAGNNTVGATETGTKFYKYTATHNGKLLFEGNDKMRVTFPKGPNKYDGNYEVVKNGNACYMGVTAGTEYLMKLENVAQGDVFTLTESDFAAGESRETAIAVQNGVYTVPAGKVNKLWVKYKVGKDCVLHMEADMPYNGNNLLQYGKSTDVYLTNLLTSELVNGNYVSSYKMELIAAAGDEYLVCLTLTDGNEGKKLNFVERDFDLGESYTHPVLLEADATNQLPAPSRIKPVWCKINLKSGNVTMKLDGYVEGYWYKGKDNAAAGTGTAIEAMRSYDPITGMPMYTVSYDIAEGDADEYYMRLDNGSGNIQLQVSGDAAYNEVVKYPHRKMYGFYLRNSNIDHYGFYSLYMDELGKADLIYPFDNSEGVYCGTVVDDTWYAVTYAFNLSGPPSPLDFIGINIHNGEVKRIGKWTTADNHQLRFQDMTYDYASQTMYAIGFDAGISSLYTFDIATGEPTKVVDFPKTVGTIAARHDGALFGATHDGRIWEINKETGALTEVFSTGLDGGMMSNQSMEFDHTTGLLYWASCMGNRDEGKDTYLVVIDLEKQQMTDNGDNIMGVDASFLGMYIPFVEAGLKAPAAPTNLVVTPAAAGAKSAVVTWNAPKKTYGDQFLSTLTSVTLERDNEVIATLDVTTPGKAMTFTDNALPDNGLYKYTVYATNEAGKGDENVCMQYVGVDIPGQVQNIHAAPLDGCGAAVITWEKPQGSKYGGYYNPDEISYRVTRYPDEKVVAEGLKNLTYTDDSFRRLARYYYAVEAVNEVGGTSTFSNYSIYGPAMEAPVLQTLEDQMAFLNTWTTKDGNNDMYTWIINSGMDIYQFGTRALALEYIINPTYTPPTVVDDADEWIITPPIKFEADKKYQISFQTRNMSTEVYEIYTGTTNVAEEMRFYKEVSLEAVPESLDGTTPFVDNVIKLPEMDGVNCVGIRLCSPIPPMSDPNNFYSREPSYFEITSFSIAEATSTAIADTAAEGEVNLNLTDNALCLKGNFDSASLYDANGRLVATFTAPYFSTSTLPQGVYVLAVKQGATTKVFKITR